MTGVTCSTTPSLQSIALDEYLPLFLLTRTIIMHLDACHDNNIGVSEFTPRRRFTRTAKEGGWTSEYSRFIGHVGMTTLVSLSSLAWISRRRHTKTAKEGEHSRDTPRERHTFCEQSISLPLIWFINMLTKHTIILLAAVAVSVQVAVDQLILTKPRDASDLGKLEALEDTVKAQARVIEDLVSRLEYLESVCSPDKVNAESSDAGNENEAVSQPSQFAKESSGNGAGKHSVFARSDNNDPLIPVVTQLTERVSEVSASVQTLKNEMIEASTSVFVHWGSSTCPNSAALVYSGVAGGSRYNTPGSAVNYLCLPLSELTLVDSIPPRQAELYGAKYQTDGGHQDKDPVCAVCRASRPTTIMIPATTVCPAGWTAEYSGFLMGGKPDHSAASEFVCVDSKMEERQGSQVYQNGKLFYFTQTVCGSLPCPPYVDGRKATCVVCSK